MDIYSAEQNKEEVAYIFHILCLPTEEVKIARITGTYKWTVGPMLKEFAFHCWSRLEMPQVLDLERMVLLDLEASLEECGVSQCALLVLGEDDELADYLVSSPNDSLTYVKVVNSPQEMISAISTMDHHSVESQSVAAWLQPDEVWCVWQSAFEAASEKRSIIGTKFIYDLNYSIWHGMDGRSYSVRHKVASFVAAFRAKTGEWTDESDVVTTKRFSTNLQKRLYCFHNAAALNLIPASTDKDDLEHSIFTLTSRGDITAGPVEVWTGSQPIHTKENDRKSDQSEMPTAFEQISFNDGEPHNNDD